MIRAAVQISTGGEAAEARFDREPAEFRLLLERQWEGVPQQEVLRVRVLEFPDYYSVASPEVGEQRFCVACAPMAFAEAVHVAVVQLRNEADAQGDIDWWGLPFPIRAFNALEATLATTAPIAS